MLSVGTAAPDFTLKDQNNQPVALSTFRDAKNVLVVFFPLAFTGICQGELDEIRDHLPVYENDDTATLAISVGPSPTHKVWATQSGFTFPVLSDFWPHGGVAQAYGVFNADGGLRQSRNLRRGPRRCHPVRRDETAGGAARPIGMDGRAEGPAGRLTDFPSHVADVYLSSDGRVAQW